MATHDVIIKSFAYSPKELPIAKGDTVKWVNQDSPAHTVTADSGKFDSGDIPKNGTFEQTFDEIGDVPYHCDHHTAMKGKIKVS